MVESHWYKIDEVTTLTESVYKNEIPRGGKYEF
ncbi:hypothetical protein [Escherichia phage BYEP02]|nr:hypothetical protein [Escherichia phage BYEP02]